MKGPVEIAEPSEYGREAGTNGEPSGVDFSEFMWMADEELDEFDRKYYEELFIEECCEEFLTTDDTNGCLPDDASPPTASPTAGPPPTTTSDDVGAGMQALTIGTTGGQSTVSPPAKLNPNAAVFVPRSQQATDVHELR